MFKLHAWPVLVALAALIGPAACATTSFHLPMTAAQLAAAHDASALILYLSQPAADPSVCDTSAPGPHIIVDDAVDRALVDALREGKAQPSIWRACVDRIFASGDRAGLTSLLDGIVRAYPLVLADPAIERDPRVQARLAALEGVYRERAPEINAHPEATGALLAELRRTVGGARIGPIARRSAIEMIATLDLERGTWEGQIVDIAFLDKLAARNDEALLARFAARLSDAALRSEAGRRVIRLRIAVSPYPEVREDAAHVEEMVMEFGKNPVSPHLQEPRRATVDMAKLPIHGVLVRQDVDHQTANFADAAATRAGASMIGPFALRGALSVEIAGLSRPVTLCSFARDLDPTPCLLPGDVAVASPLVWSDHDGGLHFVEQLTELQVVDLARGGPHLTLPVSIDGRPLTALEWPVSFSRPEDLVFGAESPGDRGPSLSVEVEEHLGRLIYAIHDGNRVHLAVAERSAARQFRIVSQGGVGTAGADGWSGSNGSDGSSGSSASCPSFSGDNGGDGGNGGNGGNGSNGGDGGDGGDVRVVVSCTDGACDETLAALRDAIDSEGGQGGAGGRGGSGGRGGQGGSGGLGTTCTDSDGHTTSLSGGLSGRSGSNGSSGADGSKGDDGKPGLVHFSVKRSSVR